MNSPEIKGGWDLITAKDVLEHIPKEKIPEILAAFRRRCKTLFIAPSKSTKVCEKCTLEHLQNRKRAPIRCTLCGSLKHNARFH